MATLQTVTFAGLPVIHAEIVIKRGTKPGVAVIRVPHSSGVTLQSGSWSITGGTSIGLASWKPDLSTVQIDYLPEGRRDLVFLAYDRRSNWSEIALQGEYNVRYRDGTVKPATQKTAAELADIALDAAGESSSTSFEASTYPYVSWNATPVTDALNALQGNYPCFVCYSASGEISVIEGGTGDALPSAMSVPATSPDFPIEIDRGPATIRVVCGPTRYQQSLELAAKGRETTGAIKAIDDLSYKPAAGWGSQHPLFFPDVAIGNRHLAFETVYRDYQVIPQSIGGTSTTFSDLWQIDLDDYLVEMAGSGDNKQDIPAFVKGCFYPYSDRPYNTGTCVHESADSHAHIDRANRMVRFAMPVYKHYADGRCIAPADLWLWTGFTLRNSDGEYDHEEFTLTRSGGTGEQVLYCPWLWKTVVTGYAAACGGGSPSTNSSVLQAEANALLGAWKNYWDRSTTIRHLQYSGVVPLNLSGIIAHVEYRLGNGLAPVTTAAENYEPVT